MKHKQISREISDWKHRI